MGKIPWLILKLQVKMIVRALKKKVNAAKTSDLIINKIGHTKNLKKSRKFLKYWGEIRSWFLRTSGDPKKPAQINKDQFQKTKNGQLLKLSCSRSLSNNTGGTIGKKFQKM